MVHDFRAGKKCFMLLGNGKWLRGSIPGRRVTLHRASKDRKDISEKNR